MAKVQAMKKSWFGDLFRGKAKARPAARAQPSTMTNIPAPGNTSTRMKAASATAALPKKAAKPAGASLAGFRMPFIGSRPITQQMQATSEMQSIAPIQNPERINYLLSERAKQIPSMGSSIFRGVSWHL